MCLWFTCFAHMETAADHHCQHEWHKNNEVMVIGPAYHVRLRQNGNGLEERVAQHSATLRILFLFLCGPGENAVTGRLWWPCKSDRARLELELAFNSRMYGHAAAIFRILNA